MTTLLDPEQASKADLASLYRARWNNELDLRSIKVTLQMDTLRCKTPNSKEIWMHLLAYNLIRTAAGPGGGGPRGRAAAGVQLHGDAPGAGVFRDGIDHQADRGDAHRETLYRQILQAIAVHRVADRPDRFEPRMAKQRPKRYDRLTRPRREIKLRMFKRVRKSAVPFAADPTWWHCDGRGGVAKEPFRKKPVAVTTPGRPRLRRCRGEQRAT